MPGAEHMPLPFRNDRRWGFSSERLGITFHGNTVTHVDSPCHIFWDGTMYNGRSHSLVDPQRGSAWAAITSAASVARACGCGPGDAVAGLVPDEVIEAWLVVLTRDTRIRSRREAAEVEDGAVLGAAPPTGLPEPHALWRTAHAQLDLPECGADETVMSDGQLRARIAAAEWENHRITSSTPRATCRSCSAAVSSPAILSQWAMSRRSWSSRS